MWFRLFPYDLIHRTYIIYELMIYKRNYKRKKGFLLLSFKKFTLVFRFEYLKYIMLVYEIILLSKRFNFLNVSFFFYLNIPWDFFTFLSKFLMSRFLLGFLWEFPFLLGFLWEFPDLLRRFLDFSRDFRISRKDF